MGGVGQPGVIFVLQVNASGGPTVWVGVLGAVRFDDAGDGGIPYGVIKEYHCKSGKAEGQQDLGDTGSGGGLTGDEDEVGGGVHWATADNGGAVGGPTPTLGGLYERNGIRGGGGHKIRSWRRQRTIEEAFCNT